MDQQMLGTLIGAGVNVFRLNMSHSPMSELTETVKDIRVAEEEAGRPIAIMADLRGPKLRIGKVENGELRLKKGQTIEVDLTTQVSTTTRIGIRNLPSLSTLTKGQALLLDDGRIGLVVEECFDDFLTCRVTHGGVLTDNKGVNFPGATLPVSALSKKDRDDVAVALDCGVDWISLSFVQTPEDVLELRELVGTRASILAKIERPSAYERISEIVDCADAVMVARGDLGVELPVEDVPAAQKELIQTARRAGKPVVVATQMLESMVTSSVPTRAEVSDVANAIYDGADALMLSGETAIGDYPEAAVLMMDRVARTIEGKNPFTVQQRRREDQNDHGTGHAIATVAGHVAGIVRAASIVTFTTGGSTAMRVSQGRPATPILVLTPKVKVARKLCLVWGLEAVTTEDAVTYEEMISKSQAIARHHFDLQSGDSIVVTAGFPFDKTGATNVLQVVQIG
jgi:pyruvate kinase